MQRSYPPHPSSRLFPALAMVGVFVRLFIRPSRAATTDHDVKTTPARWWHFHRRCHITESPREEICSYDRQRSSTGTNSK